MNHFDLKLKDVFKTHPFLAGYEKALEMPQGSEELSFREAMKICPNEYTCEDIDTFLNGYYDGIHRDAFRAINLMEKMGLIERNRE